MAQDVKLLTTGEAGRKLQTSAETMRRWCADGRIPAIPMPNGRWRIREDVVDAILNGDLALVRAA